MKHFYPVFLAFIFIQFTTAQQLIYEVPFTEQINESSLVVEGKVISKSSFWDSNYEHIYTVNTIEVYKNFKGNISSEIEVITRGGQVDGFGEVVNPSLNLNVGEIGVFMLDNEAVTLDRTPTNLPKFHSFGATQGFYEYDLLERKASNPFLNESIENNAFYNKIQESTNQLEIVKPFVLEENYEVELQSGSGGITPFVITSFTPTTITAGTESTITITGTNFGTSQGTVQFRDANSGGTTFTSALASQVIGWTNSQIIVQVPSAAGTGTIRVQTTSNGTFTSSTPLTVSYSVLNAGNSTFDFRTHKISDNGAGGYTWTKNSAFLANTAADAAFTRAFNNWICATGVNWTISGSTTFENSAINNATNVISFGNLDPGFLGVTFSYFQSCSAGGSLDVYLSGFDMIFNNTVNWNFSTTLPSFSQFDFESVALHELGHAHQLGHVILQGQVMHFAIGNGQFNRTLSTNDIAGGEDVMSFSSGGACGIGGITEITCPTLNISEFEHKNELRIYPNPVRNICNIESINNIIQVEAYNNNGKVVFNRLFNKITNKVNLDLSKLNSGVYILKVIDEDGHSEHRKIIKQ